MFKKKETSIPQDKKQEIFSKIKPIIARELNTSEDNVSLTSRIKEDLGADSLDAIEIIMALEETFRIEIMDEEAEKMQAIEDIVVYLAQSGI
jgi:acyl carrier protein